VSRAGEVERWLVDALKVPVDAFGKPVFRSDRELWRWRGVVAPSESQLRSLRRAITALDKNGAIHKRYSNKTDLRPDLAKGTVIACIASGTINHPYKGKDRILRAFERYSSAVALTLGPKRLLAAHDGACRCGRRTTLDDSTDLCKGCFDNQLSGDLRAVDRWARYVGTVPPDRLHSDADWKPGRAVVPADALRSESFFMDSDPKPSTPEE
jgi:hypothetical protein